MQDKPISGHLSEFVSNSKRKNSCTMYIMQQKMLKFCNKKIENSSEIRDLLKLSTISDYNLKKDSLKIKCYNTIIHATNKKTKELFSFFEKLSENDFFIYILNVKK
jgi:hypothetical protein